MLSYPGFEQAVLPREWSCQDIAAVCDKTRCDWRRSSTERSASLTKGRRFISRRFSQRSANRGQCAQYCRMTYDLVDAQEQKLRRHSEHLLSLRDLNRTENHRGDDRCGCQLLQGGGDSPRFPCANVTAHYCQVLDEILIRRSGELRRPSWGAEIHHTFSLRRPLPALLRPTIHFGAPIPTDLQHHTL